MQKKVPVEKARIPAKQGNQHARGYQPQKTPCKANPPRKVFGQFELFDGETNKLNYGFFIHIPILNRQITPILQGMYLSLNTIYDFWSWNCCGIYLDAYVYVVVFMTVKTHKKWIFRIPGLFLVLLILVLPASAAEAANLEIVSKERPYDSDNPVMSQVSPDFKLGKGILTTTYEISSYPGTGVSQLVGWGRVDENTYIPYLYPKDRKATPTFGIVGQPYKEVNTFEITESLGDMLFHAWLNAPSVCQSMAICQQGTQLAAKQKFTIEFQSADGGATSNDGNDGSDNQIPDLSGTWGGAWSAGYLGQCEIRQSGSSLTFINDNGQSSSGKFIDSDTVIASDWEGGLIGHITQDGNRIEWENASWWER